MIVQFFKLNRCTINDLKTIFQVWIRAGYIFSLFFAFEKVDKKEKKKSNSMDSNPVATSPPLQQSDRVRIVQYQHLNGCRIAVRIFLILSINMPPSTLIKLKMFLIDVRRYNSILPHTHTHKLV